MNPDKLFDYLEGKLSPADRAQLEERLMADPQLRREFEVARQIHRSGGGEKREVIVPSEDPSVIERSGRLGRQLATAAIVLVVLNVAAGLAVITWKSKKPSGPNRQEAAMRKQLEESLGAAGKNALPAPTFVEDSIRMTAPRGEWDAIAARVAAAAEQCGGSAAKGLSEETGLTVMADVPTTRSAEFRQLLNPAASPTPLSTDSASSPNERTIVKVRIAEAAR